MPFSTLSESLEHSTKNLSPEDAAEIRKSISQLTPDLILQLESLFKTEDSSEQAYMTIGAAAGQGAWGADAFNEGKRIFNNFRNNIKTAICGNKALRGYCENSLIVDRITLVAAIAGALLSAHTAGIDIISAAYLVSKNSIQTLCKNEWKIPIE